MDLVSWWAIHILYVKREIDTLLTDRDMAHARRVSHTDFRGTVHSTLSLGIYVKWWCVGVRAVPSHARKIETVAARHRIITGIT